MLVNIFLSKFIITNEWNKEINLLVNTINKQMLNVIFKAKLFLN